MTTMTLPPVPTTRRLATVETITDLAPIPDADAIVRARIRGWDVVVKVGEFAVGDPCVYFEVDSLIDVADSRFEFLAARGVRTDSEGVYGHVLKTARLRGQYSQGLALPLTAFPELDGVAVGDDVTDLLPVIKWEPPIPASIAGQVRGPLPSWIPTTDEERIQNIAEILTSDITDWVATEKIDGTSATFYVDPEAGVRGTCSRNWDLVEHPDNTLWAVGLRHDIHAHLAATYPGQRAAVQGEVFGEGIQGNPLRIKGQRLAIFTVRVGTDELPRDQWPAWALAMSVPVRDELPQPVTVEGALADVETLKSAITPGALAEGVVWRSATQPIARLAGGTRVRASWKCLSRKYLMKHDR